VSRAFDGSMMAGRLPGSSQSGAWTVLNRAN